MAQKSSQNLVALVVTYNRINQLKVTLDCLLHADANAVVVVENKSTDGTREWLQEQQSDRLHLLAPDENLGGAGGFELGMRWIAKELDPDWIVVMDDDARPCTGAFSEFHNLDKTDWDILSAAVFYPDGDICEMNRTTRNPFGSVKLLAKTLYGAITGRGRAGFHISDEDYENPSIIPIDIGSFVGMFISRKAIQRNGYPDGELFIYADDVIYSLRAGKMGLSHGFAPMIVFEHDCKTNSASKIYTPHWKIYYNYRNTLLAYRLALGWAFPFAAPLLMVKWAYAGLQADIDNAIFFKEYFRAIKDAFTTILLDAPR